jgi:hypothetical protein
MSTAFPAATSYKSNACLAPAAILCVAYMLRAAPCDTLGYQAIVSMNSCDTRYAQKPPNPVGNSFPSPLWCCIMIPSQLPPRVIPNSPPGRTSNAGWSQPIKTCVRPEVPRFSCPDLSILVYSLGPSFYLCVINSAVSPSGIVWRPCSST